MRASDILPPRSWRRRLVIAAAVTLLLYTITGFFLVPWLARPRLEALLADYLGKPVRIGALDFNPFALSLSLGDVTLDPESAEPAIAFDELYADVRVPALARMAVVLDSVHLQAPRVRLVLDKQGQLNLAQMFAGETADEPPPAETPADAELFPVSIASVTIDAGQLVFRDEQPAEPVELTLAPLTLELTDFSTRRDHRGNHVVAANLGEDGVIEWRGSLSIDPLKADGEIALDQVRVLTLARYAGAAVPFRVKAGTLGLKTKYAYDGSGATMQLRIGPGDAAVTNLELLEGKDTPPFLTLPELQVGGVEIDLDNQRVKVGQIRSKGARLQAWLDAAGVMGPPALFGSPATEAEAVPAEPAKEEGGWAVAVGDVTISDYGVAFEDRSLSPPFALAVEPIGATIAGLSFVDGEKATVDVELGLPDNGSIKAKGTAGLTPLDVDLELRIADIGLSRLQPYLGRAVRIDLDSGGAAAEGRLKMRAGDGGTTVLEYAGKAGVADLVVNDTVRDEELVKWSSLALNQIAYQSEPATLRIAEVILEQPYARILIDKDGNLNLTALPVESEATPAAEPATAGGETMAVAIDTMTIREGLTDFADLSIKPSVDTGIYDLNGTIEGLSSDAAARSKVSLTGNVGKHAPVRITGVINPFNPMTQTDLHVKFDNVGLTMFTPYSARFAGYKIKKGKAAVELTYKIEDRKLTAENKVVLDKLTLGEKVSGPDATSLPVRLAVALLKDRKGQIDIDLPIRGDLDDPKFSYTRVLSKTLFDLIQKAVASPFSMIGSLASFDSEELNQVDFAAGSPVLDEAQTKKLDAIGQALRDRPELRLEVTGRTDQVADKKALAEAELTKELKRLKRAALKAKGHEAPKKLSQIELSAEEYDSFFAAKYEATFGRDAPRDERGEIAAVAHTALVGSLTVDDGELRQLAQKRAAAIQDRLAEAGVEAERVYILEVEIDGTVEAGEVSSELSLTS